MKSKWFLLVWFGMPGGILFATLPQEEPAQTDSEQHEYEDYEIKVLWEKESLYHYIRVVEENGSRKLQFRRSGEEYEESVINIRKPLQLEMTHYTLMFAGFAHQPRPKKILFIGLGGGTISMAIHHYFSNVHLDNIELDPEVLNAAKRFFGFRESERMKVYVRDGRVQVRRFQREKQKYDIIMVDAFRGGYIPYHLTTKEFMESLKSLLAPNGVIVSNLRTGFKSYHYHRRTFATVFPNEYSYGSSGNVIVVVDTRKIPLTKKELLETARKLQKEKKFTFDLSRLINDEFAPNTYEKQGRILTDDYAPTDVLRSIPSQ
jgi:spermidine synthase